MRRAVELHESGAGPGKVIARLVEVWRTRPAPEFARAIERIAAGVAPATVPKSTKEFLQRAVAVAAEDVAELAALLGCLRTRRLDETHQRVAALQRLVPDPRVATVLGDFLRDVPYTSSSSQPLWCFVLDVLASAGDPRVLDRLRDIHGGWKIRHAMQAWLTARIENLQARLVERFPEGAPALDADGISALTEIVGPGLDADAAPKPPPPAGGAREALLAAVYASPDDDGPRLVLADHLQIDGDPHGELIALQCHRARGERPSARERELVSKHGKAWLGEIARYVHAKCVFRRGFLAEARLKVQGPREAEWARDLPGWATVESLALGRWQSQELPRTLRALREVHNVFETGLSSLCRLPHLRPRVVAIAHALVDLDVWRAFEESPVSSELRAFRSVSTRFIGTSKLLQQLEEVVFSQPLHEDHVELAAANPRLRVIVQEKFGEIALGRDADGLLAMNVLAKTKKRNEPAALEALEARMDSMVAVQRWDLESIGGTKGTRTPTAPALRPRSARRLRTPPKLPALAWTERGIVVPHETGIAVLDPATGDVIAHHVTSDHGAAAVARSGMAVAIYSMRLDVFDPLSGARLASLARDVLDGVLHGLSDDGSVVFAGDSAYDLPSGRARWTSGDGSWCITVDPAATRAVLRAGVRLHVRDLEDGTTLLDIDVGTIAGLAVDAGAVRAATLGRDHRLRIVDVATGEVLLDQADSWTADAPHYAPGVALAGGVAATASKTGGVVLFDVATGARRVLAEGHALDVTFSPDGTRVCAKLYHELIAIDVASAAVLWRLPTA